MPKIWIDGVYEDITEEELLEKYPPDSTPQPPSTSARLSALEAAVAEIALREAAGEVQNDV